MVWAVRQGSFNPGAGDLPFTSAERPWLAPLRLLHCALSATHPEPALPQPLAARPQPHGVRFRHAVEAKSCRMGLVFALVRRTQDIGNHACSRSRVSGRTILPRSSGPVTFRCEGFFATLKRLGLPNCAQLRVYHERLTSPLMGCRER